MIQKFGFKYHFILIVIFQLIVGFSYSQETIFVNDQDNEDIEYEFYKYVIDEYVRLIQKVEKGDAPFIVIVKDIHVIDSLSILNIKITFTNNFNQIAKYKGSFIYFYKSDKVAIVIDKLAGMRTAIDYFIQKFDLKKITDDVLLNQLYPLTFDAKFKINDSIDHIDLDKYDENDIFTFWKYGNNEIGSFKNGKIISFLKDFKSTKN